MTTQEDTPQALQSREGGFCVFEYLYRDASNYKAWGELLLSGTPTDGEIAALRERLESGEYFIAEQVGIPAVYEELWKFSDGPTEDDHALHEFVSVRSATASEIESMPLFETWPDLLLKFQNITTWNYGLSQNRAGAL